MKDHTRDYATAAFAFYKQHNRSVKQFKNYIYKEALENYQKGDGTYGVSKPTEAAIVAAERELEYYTAQIADMEAVEKTINILEMTNGGSHIIKALEIVYLPGNFEKGEIERRIHKAEIEIPAGTRTIYGWLKKARAYFAEERGLRI